MRELEYNIPECELNDLSEVKLLSRVRLFVTPWTVAYKAPPSMGFSRREYWSGFPKEGVPKHLVTLGG